MKLPPAQWGAAGLNNIFQHSVFTHHPAIANAHQMLVQAGAVYAAMSGSGSTCFGFFTNKPDLEKAKMPQSWIFKEWQL
jgi:4-diphosphocytidyl-2-C-methyl-D-erythritol kinase